MIKIGFVDYYLDEWHASNYSEFFDAAAKKLGVECSVVGAFATLHTPPFENGITTDEWCKEHGIPRYDDIAELAKVCDAFVIFAPDSPEQHYHLASLTLPFGKRTFIDKTFANSEDDAKAIIALAKKYGAPMYSTSSLRYATEVEAVKGSRDVDIAGNYVHMKDYLVHTGEMVVTVLGVGITEVNCRLEGETYYFDVKYNDGRHADVEMAPSYTFRVNGEEVKSNYFGRQIENILAFFNGAEPTVRDDEMIEVARFIDMAKEAISRA